MVMSVVSPNKLSLSTIFSRGGGYYHESNSNRRSCSPYASSSMAYDVWCNCDIQRTSIQLKLQNPLYEINQISTFN